MGPASKLQDPDGPVPVHGLEADALRGVAGDAGAHVGERREEGGLITEAGGGGVLTRGGVKTGRQEDHHVEVLKNCHCYCS